MTMITGGCQCGAVRYQINELGRASICHCRMCQKAFGSFFGPLVSAIGIKWTKDPRTLFQSSNRIKRGFCSECGTPLTYEHDQGTEIAIGSLDNPDLAPPAVQVNLSAKRSCVDGLFDLPEVAAAVASEDQGLGGKLISFQHPDHET